MNDYVSIAGVYSAEEFRRVVKLLQEEGAPSAGGEGSVAYDVVVRAGEEKRAVEVLREHLGEFELLDILGKDDPGAPVYLAVVRCARGLELDGREVDEGGVVYCFVTARDKREVLARLDECSRLRRWKVVSVESVDEYEMGTEEGVDGLQDALLRAVLRVQSEHLERARMLDAGFDL